MEKLDYKKKFKEQYQPKTEPSVVDVPEMTFIQIDGFDATGDVLRYPVRRDL